MLRKQQTQTKVKRLRINRSLKRIANPLQIQQRQRFGRGCFPSNASAFSREVAKTNPTAGLRLALWQAPIDFYGKVVDENGNAVEGASVGFGWMELPIETGNRTASTKSDAAGLFSLRGQRGPNLSVSVSKEGYYAAHRGQMSFNYALGNEDFKADPQNPIVFNFRKKGLGQPLLSLKRNYAVPRDGTPVSIDLVTGATAHGQNGNLVIQCWTQDQGKKPGEKYDWRCTVTVPGGGEVPTSDEFAFQAPEGGYMPSTEVQMIAGQPDWKDDVDLKFYFRLADGRYGRMTFSIIAGGQHFCIIDSVLNPSGSSNLEPAN